MAEREATRQIQGSSVSCCAWLPSVIIIAVSILLEGLAGKVLRCSAGSSMLRQNRCSWHIHSCMFAAELQPSAGADGPNPPPCRSAGFEFTTESVMITGAFPYPGLPIAGLHWFGQVLR